MHANLKKILVISSLIVSGPALAFAAWTAAPATPPNNNIDEPVNIGGTGQTKTGALVVGALGVSGGAVVSGNIYAGGTTGVTRVQLLGTGGGNAVSEYFSNEGNPRWSIGRDLINGGQAGIKFGINGTFSAVGTNASGNALVFQTNGGNERMRIDSSGNVGIGVTVPGYKLQVGSAGDGSSIGSNAFFYLSDASLKKDVSTLDGALSKVLSLRGISFTWKNAGTKDIGVIAQEVEKVYPELVTTGPDGLKSVKEGNLVAPLIEAVKEQQKQIDALKAEIELLKNK